MFTNLPLSMTPETALFEVVIGTYEKYLLGYSLAVDSDVFSLKPSFGTEAHSQSVKCISSSEKYLASGSTDETIQLFNMKTRQEIGSLLHHNGTVTSLAFYDSYLMSSSEDNTICIWSTNNWQCLKTLSGHKAAVNCISIHPTGKMALSVSKDKTLRTWNLIKGRSAYVTNIKKDANSVLWSPDGSHFLVIYGCCIDVYSVEAASILKTINLDWQICDLTFLNDFICVVSGENENIRFYDIKSGSCCYQFKAHSCRIKAIKYVSVNEENFLVTVSSDGVLKVWHIAVSGSDYKTSKLAKMNTGSRPTCLTVLFKQQT